MTQNADKITTETHNDEVVGHADQPVVDEIVGYANQPPPEGTVPNALDKDYVFQACTETVARLDELIAKVDSQVHKPKWLSAKPKDLRDRLVEAKKPIIEMVNRIRVNGPPVQEEDNSMYLELFGYWKVVDPLISEVHKWLGE
ncbi:hypothetical protein CDV31_014114 [Fusarium ambrosium]|uniref:Uncharacterized protein n=1 Tax=Fusarium ambrosium TaxID=131363 RepID=A0A428SYR3_9HYPO|nr:hypothetical protein CDV31_014114 [Fusarium ambrosium]